MLPMPNEFRLSTGPEIWRKNDLAKRRDLSPDCPSPLNPNRSRDVAMAGYSQQEHILRIDTILNDESSEKEFEGDPLLLAKLDGVEGISRLFGYDVVMLRDAGGAQGATVNGEKRPPIDATKLINTHVVIGARP